MDVNLKNIELNKGTTTVGILCKDGVVLAADKRVTVGYMVSNKKYKKIVQISDHMAMTTAGMVSDAQLFTKLIKAQLALLSLRKGKEPKVIEAANLLANLTYTNIRRPSMIPGIVAFILGGYDDDGYHLYEVGVDGSVTKADNFISEGSGSQYAYGVLETLYQPNITVQEGAQLGIKAINAAIQRDMPTGEGIDVVVITKAGVKQIIEKEIVSKLS